MLIRRQNLRHLSPRNIALLSCIIAFFMSSSWAFCMQSRSDSLLSSYGLTGRQFENKAKEYLGIPYRKGGTSKKGMDCSGFAKILYGNIFSIELPHSSIEQYRFSELQKISTTGMQPGDLVFFGNKGGRKINHVGVYLANGQFIHASSSKGITVSRLGDRYWKKRFVCSKRHVGLKTRAEVNQLQLENSLKIPVHPHGTLSGYIRRELQSYYSAFLENDLDIFSDGRYDISKFDNIYLRFYQIG